MISSYNEIEKKSDRIQARVPEYTTAAIADIVGSESDFIISAVESILFNRHPRIRLSQKLLYGGYAPDAFFSIFEDAIGTRGVRRCHESQLVDSYNMFLENASVNPKINNEREYFYKNAKGISLKKKDDETIADLYGKMADRYRDESISVTETLLEEMSAFHTLFAELQEEMLAWKNASFSARYIDRYDTKNEMIDFSLNIFKSYMRDIKIPE